ncbi:MAG: hypothetical protein KJZ68_10725 [Phycisphaerales bacterium]|nr:hypothetical protein [Phycisphaerales bacterium]
MLTSRVAHLSPVLAVALPFMTAQGPPGSGVGCYLVKWQQGGCVAEDLFGPELICAEAWGHQWVVYQESRQVCSTDFVGQGKVNCIDTPTQEQGGEPWHPQKQWYRCDGAGQIIEWYKEDHLQVTCVNAIYGTPAPANCERTG